MLIGFCYFKEAAMLTVLTALSRIVVEILSGRILTEVVRLLLFKRTKLNRTPRIIRESVVTITAIWRALDIRTNPKMIAALIRMAVNIVKDRTVQGDNVSRLNFISGCMFCISFFFCLLFVSMLP